MTGLLATALPAAAAALLTVEAGRRLPFGGVLRTSRGLAGKSLRLIRAATVSDHWKERALPAYSAGLFKESLRLLGMIALLVATYAGAVACVGFATVPGFALDAALAGAPQALCATAAAAIYLGARRVLFADV